MGFGPVWIRSKKRIFWKSCGRQGKPHGKSGDRNDTATAVRDFSTMGIKPRHQTLDRIGIV
jgi:hypothetical protein